MVLQGSSHEGQLIRGESLTYITNSHEKSIFDTAETDISKRYARSR